MQTDVVADIPRGEAAGPREIKVAPRVKKWRPRTNAKARAKRIAKRRAANKAARQMRRARR